MAAKKGAKIARRFVAPFLSEPDSQMVGEELEKIALAQRVNNIRHLDPEMVFKIIENTPSHPLWKVYEKNKNKAARKHWVDFTRKLITGIRVVTIDAKKRRTFQPVYISAEAPVKTPGSAATRRTRVFASDVLSNDPIFLSAVSGKLRRLVGVLKELEHLTARRPTPPDVQQFLGDVRAAVSSCSLTCNL